MSEHLPSDDHTYTTGPWRISEHRSRDNCYVRIDSPPHWHGFAQVVVRMSDDEEDSPEGLANARLIAAAPDMLAALKCLLPGLVLDRRYADDDDDLDALDSRIETVLEAIKKATDDE